MATLVLDAARALAAAQKAIEARKLPPNSMRLGGGHEDQCLADVEEAAIRAIRVLGDGATVGVDLTELRLIEGFL